jgi:hypothetical protein
LAQDEDGNEVSPSSPLAVSWSLLGALIRVARSYREMEDLAEKLTKRVGWRLQAFNETTTHSELLRVLKKARV